MKAKKRLKKLKKGYVGPSIFILLMAILLCSIAAMLNMGMAYYFMLDDKLTDAGMMTAEITMQIQEAPEEKRQELVEELTASIRGNGAITVFDRKGKILYSGGSRQWNGESALDLGDGLIYESYLDEMQEDTEDGKGVFSLLDPFELIRRDKSDRLPEDADYEEGKRFLQREVISLYFWTEVPELADGEMRILVRSSVALTSKEIALVVVLSISAIMMVGFSFLFLLINVIINIINRNRMAKLLYTDNITGGNNSQFMEHYGNWLMHSLVSRGKNYAVLDLEIMQFQHYCICHGAVKGERLLENIDRYLSKKMKRTEKCAYMGSGRFALIVKCGKHTDEERCTECEERFLKYLEEFSKRFDCSSLSFHVGLCHLYSKADKNLLAGLDFRKHYDFETCYNNAAIARLSVAEVEGNKLVSFGEALLEQQLWEHKVEESMQKALDNEEFQVYMQPKYHPVTEKLSGAEALVRWISPTEGFIGPGKFIPIFEKNGFITKLDDYMLEHVAALQAKWLAEGKKIVPVSVNVSRAHFADPNLAEEICSVVDKYKVPRQYIEIELTESAFFDDKKILSDTVAKLKNYGFTVSMDDFGAGYSSLNSLKDLPLDILKLDAEFFRGENAGERGEIVVSRVINLAKDLNMKIVAEGIEEKNQVEFLAGQGCDMIQGFYFAKPMPAADYESRMEAAEAKSAMAE